MYHFMATCAPEPLELSERVQIPGHIRQYLRDFQVDTLRFLHKHLENRDFCILNDESGLGKCVATAVYLCAIAKNKKTLIVVQNDDELVTGWQFHFEVLTNLSVGVLALNTSSLDPLPNIIIAKWGTLRTNVDVSKFNFDYVIIDNRAELMNNNFCMSMLLSNYEHKVNLVISSFDVASDLKQLHNCLRLGGRLEHQYEQFRNFEAKYKLPNSKDVLNKTADLEQYYMKREMISDYCRDFRLRRYRHQYEDQLPLVDVERYKISLDLWHTISSSNSSQRSNENDNNLNANSETATEELFNQALALDREVSQIIESRQNLRTDFDSHETSEEAMSPLLIDSESYSSDEPEVVNISIEENQHKQPEPDVYEFVDLSTEPNSDELTSNNNLMEQTTKPVECQSNPSNNQKTSPKNSKNTKAIDNIMVSVESPISDKKTIVDDFKETLAKKTILQREGNASAVNNSATTNNNKKNYNERPNALRIASPKKRQKQDELTKNHMSDTTETEYDKTQTVIATRRRKVNQSQKISEQPSKKLKSPEEVNDISKEKAANQSPLKLSVGKTTRSAVNKRKCGENDALSNNESSISPAKRPSLKHAKSDINEKINKKYIDEKTRENRSKKLITQAEEDKSDISARRLRQKDENDTQNRKTINSPKKSTNSTAVGNTTPTKESAKCELVDADNSSNVTPEKRKLKNSPKNKSKVETPLTPTSRSTRSMQRITRSGDNIKSKYMRSALVLEDNRKHKANKKGRTPKDKKEEEEKRKQTKDEQVNQDSKSIKTDKDESIKSKEKSKQRGRQEEESKHSNKDTNDKKKIIEKDGASTRGRQEEEDSKSLISDKSEKMKTKSTRSKQQEENNKSLNKDKNDSKKNKEKSKQTVERQEQHDSKAFNTDTCGKKPLIEKDRPNNDKKVEINSKDTSEMRKSKKKGRPASDSNEEPTMNNRDREDIKSFNKNASIEIAKSKQSHVESGNRVGEKKATQTVNKTANKQKRVDISQATASPIDSSILPRSQNTEDMQCGQKIISDLHSDIEFLRPPTPIRSIRNSEHKNFLSTQSSIADSEVVFVPPPDTSNRTQQVVILSSSTDDGSLSSNNSTHNRRTSILKQKKLIKRLETERLERLKEQKSKTPTFGELLAKQQQQQLQRRSPDIFTASTDLELTCTQHQQPAVDVESNVEAGTFQGFKIFGSEVKQLQQQNASNNQSNAKRSTQILSRGRSCLNILEKMFDSPPTATTTDNNDPQNLNQIHQISKKKPDVKLVKSKTTKLNQPVVPALPKNASATTIATQLQQQQQQQTHEQPNNHSKQTQNNATKNPILSGGGPMLDEEIFEITNNDAFGSMMRINSNGEISPVQTTTARSQQQATQHNKITNYLIGSTQPTPATLVAPTAEATVEERTPSKRAQLMLAGVVTRRSPKNRTQCTQTTKLTKWFQKNGATQQHNDAHSNVEHDELRLGKYTRSTMAKRLKRRCLELSFRN